MTPEQSCLDKLNKFLASSHRNRWLESEHLKVYVRRSQRLVNGQAYKALDIATIDAEPTGQGIGTRFITAAHELNPFPVTFVENSLHEGLTRWLARNGWLEHSLPYCWYKLK